ncbi:RICIN domain-containing protein [Nonomuraea sp. NPDC048826]|uniref:RICIN domain-containing protein n=1 Tax=Nonomuraea sp. NPDC048826 TaxID=3364347 RepID=UPI00371370B3
MIHRTRLRAIMSVAALTACWPALVSGSPASAAATAKIGVYSISSPSYPNGCVGSVQAERPRMYRCDPFDQRQQWEFTASPHPGAPSTYRQIRNVFYNMCIDAHDSGGRLGPVYLRDCNTSANQAWEINKGEFGLGYACVWKAPACDLKLEWRPLTRGEPAPTLALPDKYSHIRDHDIWYVWRNLPPRPVK